MHITIIRHSIRNRGGDRLVLDYLTYLIKQGHDVVYWTNEVNTCFPIHPKIQIKKIPWPAIPGTILYTVFSKFKTDILIVDLVVMAYFASLRNKGKILYLAQDYDVSYHRPLLIKKLIEWCYQLVLTKKRIPTISVSEGLTEKLKRYAPKNLQTISNGVDCEMFSANPNTNYQHRREHPFVILLFARKDFRKGLDIAKKTLEELRRIRSSADWEVWTIGEENLVLDKIEVKNWGFVKKDEDLRDVLSAADIYFIPSRSEGLSLLLLQALACGCAIVTTVASSNIEHELNGLVSPIENWKGLAQNLDRVMSDHILRKKLKKNARLLAEQYSLQKSCARLEEVLLEWSDRV